MTRAVVPLASLSRRLPEAGRIRTGIQVPASRGKTRPKAIETFRFTSADRTAIEQVAEIYGGEPREWSDAPTPGQWEVITDSAELHVVLPPDPLGGTPIYEQWSAGGCQRRCDGGTCQTLQDGPDGPEPVDVPCICHATGEMSCAPHTRLSVLLPDVRFSGTWRYESATSWNVAQELPGMVDLIQQLQARGLTRALLGIEHRKSTAGGKTKRFTIPVLRVDESLDALAAGASQVGALSDRPALGPGEGGESLAGRELPSPDDEIHDAEIVEDRCSDETWEAVRAFGANLDPVDQDALKAWAEAKGWEFTRGGLSEEQAQQVLAWEPQ